MMELECLTAMHDRTWHSSPPFKLSVIPPHSVRVSDGERYILLIVVLPLIGICDFGVTGKFTFDLSSSE